ncbi:hypothetical protein AA105894_0406 [Asaia spathodeae NBRC 105894]|nr:hypothetical protein AA105894_0406 [Asaia spathodeae NBRC 105894]
MVKRVEMAVEQNAIGGQGYIVDTRQGDEPCDQRVELGAQQWLATGQAQLADAKPRRNAGDTLYCREIETLCRFEKGEIVVEHRLRHAIRAAKIASIHDRNAQIVPRPCQKVFRLSGC